MRKLTRRVCRLMIWMMPLLLAAPVRTLAIEGLHISLQCSNVVLSWPSDVTSGETYIVQYRSDLASTNPWTTLTNYMPPDAGTNVTIFTHSNVVQKPNCGGQSDVFLAEPAAGTHQPSPFDGLMVMRSGAPGSMTPLCLYPIGLRFYGFSHF
ncbi:MAG TPA: hypothetical protein VHH88_12350 [Verrucomicrobiae bacterium]|nr:hypothetical protein [Verrucomicrobiae bacterium]